jgi:hypothetical protein
VLFIAPEFYGYEKIISDKIIEYGASVLFYPERKNSFSYKLAANLTRDSLIKYQNKYYQEIYDAIKDLQIDYFFVIRGFLMPVEFIKNMRMSFPGATFIMHQWDSIKNHNYKRFLNEFDKIFSFDPVDCINYPTLQYLPNFYFPEFATLSNKKIIYDISFIGWAYKRRLDIIKKLTAQLPGTSFFNYLYIPFSAYLKELLKGSYLHNVKFTPVSFTEVIRIVQQSFCVLDIPDENQTGYTYRAIDAMAAGKKLITTNSNIQNEKFYNENNILIIDNHHPDIEIDFFEKPFVPVNIEEYSLSNWIKKIFSASA